MDDLRSERNFTLQKQIGRILREQYEPPADLPKQLHALLFEVDKQADDHEDEPYWRRFYE